MNVTLVDTGPIVAFLSENDEHHEWACAQWRFLRAPLITCEPVITEAAFLLKREGADTDGLFALLDRKVLRIGFQLDSELPEIRQLMRKYANRPMSLADACLVRLSEVAERSVILTLDDDFRFYRRHGNRLIPTLMPP